MARLLSLCLRVEYGGLIMDEFVVYLLFYVVLPLVLLCIYYFVGRTIERRHIKSLVKRETDNAEILLTTLDMPVGLKRDGVPAPALVCGDAIISSDAFKTWLFSYRNFFGGESRTFTRLFDRARREATQRMIAAAVAAGHNAICNVRYESADIAGNAATNASKKTMKMAVCTVSGTAYTRV